MARISSSFSKGTSRRRWPKPSSYCPANFPPQASTLDKGHGRIELRQLWTVSTDPLAMGLAGVAQVVRIHRHIQHVRRGKIRKETHEDAFAVTTFTPQEVGPEPLLQLAREHWSIENGQHHPRDRPQDEDRCTVREAGAAPNPTLVPSF